MLARRPNRRDASIHLRHKALSALNRIRIPLYKKYGRVIGVCSEMHPNLDMRYRLRIISTVLLTYCHRMENWVPPIRDLLIRQFLDFHNISDSFSYICLRFERQHLPRLRFALKIPDFFRLNNGCTIDGEEALSTSTKVRGRLILYKNIISASSPSIVHPLLRRKKSGIFKANLSLGKCCLSNLRHM